MTSCIHSADMTSKYWIYLGLVILSCSCIKGQLYTAQIVGGDASSGRLEVTFNGVTGTVCDDRFDDVDATVACRMLGFYLGTARTANGGPAPFGEGTGIIALDSVKCFGTENNLALCQHQGWGNSDCTHSEDVGVACTGRGVTQASTPRPATPGPVPSNCPGGVASTDVRLYGTQAGIGIVEVRNTSPGSASGDWATICDDDFGQLDAEVICRMLCYNVAYARAGAREESVRATPRLPIRLDNIACTGREQNILDCPRTAWGVNDCNDSLEAARVTCVPQNYLAPPTPVPTLSCTDDLITAVFNRSDYPDLEAKHLRPNVQTAPCNPLTRTTQTLVAIGIKFDECATIKELNATHIIYRNTIHIESTYLQANVLRANTYLVHVACEFDRSGRVDDRAIQPITQSITQRAPGEYRFRMFFYRNDNFTHEVTDFPVKINLGEFLNVGVVLNDLDTGLKLIVPNCKASPTADPASTNNYPLIVERCPADPNMATFPWNRTSFAFQFQTIKFLGDNPTFYVTCDTFVCSVQEKNANCDQTCTNSLIGRRKRRSIFGNSHPVYHVSAGPVQLQSSDPPDTIVQPAVVVQQRTTTKFPNQTGTKNTEVPMFPPVNVAEGGSESKSTRTTTGSTTGDTKRTTATQVETRGTTAAQHNTKWTRPNVNELENRNKTTKMLPAASSRAGSFTSKVSQAPTPTNTPSIHSRTSSNQNKNNQLDENYNNIKENNNNIELNVKQKKYLPEQVLGIVAGARMLSSAVVCWTSVGVLWLILTL